MGSNLFFKIFSYCNFIYLSKNHHGVHSPFIYGFVTKCCYDFKIYVTYKDLKSYRNSLYKNKNFIEIQDFGAGSKVFESNRRQISKIAITAGISAKRAKLLFRIIRYFKPQNILEIGSSLGLATVSMAISNKNSKIISLEGCSETAAICKGQLHKYGIENVDILTIEFEKYFTSLNILNKKFDLIYFDGNHSQQATLLYFELLLPTTSNNTVWIFDDIHWSSDMEQAWGKIKKHPKVTVTIDTFQWGIVFFRKEQAKENFTIRM